MGVDVRNFDLANDEDARKWDRLVDRGDDIYPFYRASGLLEQSRRMEAPLYALAGFKGQEPVGIFPVYETRMGPLTAVFSPAPYSWTGFLGPRLLGVEEHSRRKLDRTNRRFLETCLEWIDEHLAPAYSRYTLLEYEDIRPFTWNGFDVEVDYTYIVDLTKGDERDGGYSRTDGGSHSEGSGHGDGSRRSEGSRCDERNEGEDGGEDELKRQEATLLARFSGDARRNIRNGPDVETIVSEGDGDDVEFILERVHERYDSQGQSFHLQPAAARGFYDALPDGAIRPFVLEDDGTRIGGILVVESERTRYRWLGGVTPHVEVDYSINDILDWAIMRDGLRCGIERYDLVGAGEPRINRYKAKFDPDLLPNYTLTAGRWGVDRLIEQYRKIG